ncbi:fumarylacetoacetate hydrolase family protein [Kiloniella sp. EL199]|uniref:fumarylacetoacetate hydrolase family protein n=1 Tax=Kiloniella sp. EL199 TaxID=2107581 RepID=UPI000EA3B864|nr:fumarylacetoacetate hydrolase family protein [Kiloniella sp. EL199]
MSYTFDPAPVVTLPVVGSDLLFPVRRIFCVGRNYAEHTKEMGGDPDTETPMFFMKPAESLVAAGGSIPYPGATTDLHHEVELVVALRSGGSNISPEQAGGHIFGYATGVDLTRRDLQKICKDKRHPWDVAKGFENSAPCSSITPQTSDLLSGTSSISLRVNNEVRQQATLGDMIWSVEHIIYHLSRLFELRSGDIIMTGTPAGVGAIKSGDDVTCSIEGLSDLKFQLT